MKIFVSGGAGYIGSHVVKAMGELGWEILVYDNLSTGHEWAVLHGNLVVGDLADKPGLINALSEFKPDAVLHFAASISVEESVHDPLAYYKNNVVGTINLLDALSQTGAENLVFSSTASVYGMPEKSPVSENAPLNPLSPYGRTKVIIENMLSDLASAKRLNYTSLRYFNAAGADPQSRIGQTNKQATHLILRALMAAEGRLDRLQIFGTDYPTDDGTCIRDYIHVDDLASAHILAINHLIKNGGGNIYNLGYGHGFSVLEVVAMVKKVTGKDFECVKAERRAGDPASLIADSSRLKNDLGWKPKFDDLEYIIKTAWDWETDKKKIKEKL